MGKWLERARQLEAEASPDTPGDGAIVPIVPIVQLAPSLPVPADIAQGLMKLRTMPIPRGVARKAWLDTVEDVNRLASSGWAETALGLGWTAIDLFGCEPPGSDDYYRNGLAVWLRRRPLLLLDADSAIADSGDRRRSVFNRKRNRAGAVLLWGLSVGKSR